MLVRQLQEKAVAVEQVCRLLEVGRSGYYAARRRSRVPPAVCEAGVQLKAAFAASGGAYGSRRLRTAVASRGVVIGIFRLRRLMRQHGLRSAWKRKFVHTTDSKHALPISPNVLGRQFNPTQPNQVWATDITLYLVVVANSFRHPRRGQHGYHVRLRAWDVDVAPRLTFAPFRDRTVAKDLLLPPDVGKMRCGSRVHLLAAMEDNQREECVFESLKHGSDPARHDHAAVELAGFVFVVFVELLPARGAVEAAALST